jgi:hypothetical protein
LTTERDIDQLLVERVQRGDKKAFELLVTKYQRKLMRLVSRLVRDQAEAEDVVRRFRVLYVVISYWYQYREKLSGNARQACAYIN